MSTILLSNGELVNVPPGADPVVFKRIQEAKLRWTPRPKRSKTAKRTAPTGKTTRRSQKAAMDSAVGLATVTLVERVNSDRQQQIKDLLAEIEADVKVKLAGRNAVYDMFLRPDPLNCEPQRGGWMVKE